MYGCDYNVYMPHVKILGSLICSPYQNRKINKRVQAAAILLPYIEQNIDLNGSCLCFSGPLLKKSSHFRHVYSMDIGKLRNTVITFRINRQVSDQGRQINELTSMLPSVKENWYYNPGFIH
jgi:hypothetical protein